MNSRKKEILLCKVLGWERCPENVGDYLSPVRPHPPFAAHVSFKGSRTPNCCIFP